jgi:IPT/TIG domain-containing protein
MRGKAGFIDHPTATGTLQPYWIIEARFLPRVQIMAIVTHNGSDNQYSPNSFQRPLWLQGVRARAADEPLGNAASLGGEEARPTPSVAMGPVVLTGDSWPDLLTDAESATESRRAVDDNEDGIEPLRGLAETPKPRIVYLSHRRGPASGGTTVTILGNYFAGITEVLFGNEPATSFKVVSNNRIVAIAPPSEAEMVPVAVCTGSGVSDATPAAQFVYIASPIVTDLKPNHGPTRGGMLVVVHGANFVTGNTKVYFGKRPGKEVKVLSSRLLVVKSPPHDTGTVGLAVTTPEGVSDELPFTYH